MPETTSPLKVFLCHAHADQDAVRALYTRLIRDGVDAWLDKEKLLPGQDWEYEIRKAVRAADVVVVCLSKQFNQAGFRQKEVRLALDTAMEQPEGEIFIIPARLEECEMLESLSKLHRVDLFAADGYERLVRALQIRAERIGASLRIRKSRVPKAKKTIEVVPPATDVDNKRDAFVEATQVEQVYPPESIRTDEKKVPEAGADSPAKKPVRRRIKTEYMVAIIGAAATIIAGILSSPLIERWLASPPAPTSVPTAIMTATDVDPTQTTAPTEITPETTLNPIRFEDPHPDDGDFIDDAGIPMRLVPAGKFDLGSEDGQSDERPVHTIDLDAYYIDKYEVTNLFYKACVDAGGCRPPQNDTGLSFNDFYGKPEFDNYPVLFISWDMAKTYCEWRGAQLPTEAQWEKAARGTDRRTYPWGNDIDQTFAHYAISSSGPAAVGSYPSGKSPFGVYDMAGNAVEWVSDWYSNSFYANSPASNPSGPGSGQQRVLRGGTWYDDKDKVRASDRRSYPPDEILTSFGFRCERDVTP